MHGVFVVVELALAIVLLVSAGMIGRTLIAQSARDPGFDPHRVLAARFALSPNVLSDPQQMRAAWRQVLDRARATPGVRLAALADIIPMRNAENTLSYRTTGRLAAAGPGARGAGVDSDLRVSRGHGYPARARPIPDGRR
jgi:hypothetical protein